MLKLNGTHNVIRRCFSKHDMRYTFLYACYVALWYTWAYWFGWLQLTEVASNGSGVFVCV